MNRKLSFSERDGVLARVPSTPRAPSSIRFARRKEPKCDQANENATQTQPNQSQLACKTFVQTQRLLLL